MCVYKWKGIVLIRYFTYTNLFGKKIVNFTKCLILTERFEIKLKLEFEIMFSLGQLIGSAMIKVVFLKIKKSSEMPNHLFKKCNCHYTNKANKLKLNSILI